MLKAIVIVTILTSNLEATEDAYEEYLDYDTVEQGVISTPLARSWGAEKVAGNDYVLMQPESKANVYLRFIETPKKTNAHEYQPMKQVGWNATEILVHDPDALEKKFKHADSPFRVVGQPKFLTEKQNVRAMQVLGPNNELLYFTRIIDPEKSSFDLGQAKSFVGRVFIMVLGSKDTSKTTMFYKQQIKQDVLGPFDYRISVLSNAYGLPEDTLHPLSLSPLVGQFLIEIDQYPIAARSISSKPGELPQGVAMVSFYIDGLEPFVKHAISSPITTQGRAYLGQPSAVIKGPSGELIELIEAPSNGN